jgi:hypothetical protein
MHHRCMSNGVLRGRLVAGWCMSVLTIGALSIVLGAALTIPNAELLLAVCVVPPIVMLMVWRRAAPTAVAVVN